MIALRKAQDLLACHARVHVVAPDWHAGFAALEGQPGLSRSTRAFAIEDLEGVRIAVAATDDPDVQHTVYRECETRGILCNVVDVNHLCSFYVPAVLRRGSLTVSITTDGKFPLLAVALRDRIASWLGSRAGSALERLGEARTVAFERFPDDPEKRVSALRQLLTERAFELIVEDRLEELEAHVASWRAAS